MTVDDDQPPRRRRRRPRRSVRSERTFEPTARSASDARRFAEEFLQSQAGAPPDRAALVVAELASNAVRHGGSAFSVSLRRSGSSVRVAVTDGNPAAPVLVQPPFGASYGRGLLIVSRLSSSWGWRPVPGGGKTVWADVRLDRSLAAA